jgi:molecular chaperone DnaK
VSARDAETGTRQSITVTATSGLTESELRKILDENLDEALARRQSGDIDRLRERVQAMLEEIDGLRPQVEVALGRSRFGKDAVQRAEEVLARARLAVATEDPQQLAAVEEPLDRAVQLFKGIATSMGAPGGGA